MRFYQRPIGSELLKNLGGGLKLHKFDTTTQALFENEMKSQCVRSMWFAFPVTIILHLLMPFGARYVFVSPEILVNYHYFIAGSCFVGLALTFVESYRQNVLNLGVAVWFVCALVTIMALLFTEDGIYNYIAAAIFVILYAGGFVRTTFSRAALCCLLIFATFNAALYIAAYELKSFVFVDCMIVYAIFISLSTCYFVERLERQKFTLEVELRTERDKIDAILHDMLPRRIYEKVKRGETNIAESTGNASIAFCDMVGFTHLASNNHPDVIVNILNGLFTRFDQIASFHGVEKIKTIGDAYMAAAGVGDAINKDAYAIARFALEARDAATEVGTQYGFTLEMRFGIATGQVVSGIIGRSRPIFDVWGSTVNLASRLEGISLPGAITIDAHTASLLINEFDVQPKGVATAKGIGRVDIFELNSGKLDQR
jgi:adenylate cyclase